MLCITLDRMGWSSYARSLAAATARRDDIDAMHLHFTGAGVKRLLSVPVAGGRGRLDSNVRRVLVARWTIRRWLAGRLDLDRFDVVHVAPHLYGAGVVQAAQRTRTPLSVLLDATVSQEKGELGGRSDDEVRSRWGPLLGVEREVLERATLVVASSRWAGDRAALDFAIGPDRLLVSPFAIPGGPVDARPAATPTHQPARILFVGGDWRRKGGDRLLRWHQERWSDRAELHVCAPVSPSRRSINVIHHGIVPHERIIAELLPSMDLFVLPTWNDMSPHAVAEAAAAGLPVVSSAIGGIGEQVLDGTTGFLRAPADEAGFVEAVERLLADPDLRVRMGAAARRHVRIDGDDSANDRVLDRLVALARRP